MTLLTLALFLISVIVLLCALVPIRVGKGIRLTFYPISWFSHFLMWVLGVRYTCTDPELLRSHRGLIVCNHLSHMDVLMFLRAIPTRFMSTIGVRKIPIIGRVATTIDTIFVHRGNKDSRSEAREQLRIQLQQRPYPPLTLFPEGRIGDGTQVNEFRYGAFEVAIAQQVDTLVCALHYAPHALVDWTDESETLPHAIWRLALADQPLHATLIPVVVFDHRQFQTPAQMATDAHTIITDAFNASSVHAVRQ